MNRLLKKIILGAAGVLVVGLIAIQLVPYGRNHTNPPGQSEPNWDSPETRALAERACFDCHSNETEWPWYSNIAPVSWLVQHDVDEGREKLNFSEWNSGGEEGEEMAETIWEGEMPPAVFLITHPEARLTDAELDQLAQGLMATGGGEGSENGRGGDADDHDDDHDESHEEHDDDD
ncbi:MAG: heme-binding domain-containing protein [Anaerolineae bacterium]|nr:heme-binding domain-containing protein [Anaerolineae bacterium]